MDRIITSKELVEMTVKLLMHGRSGKVAVINKEGKPELQQKSIITQFLNNRSSLEARTRMTQKIADTLCDTILYYQICKSSLNYTENIILFMYCISGVDLTYWYQYPQLLDKNKQTQLHDLIKALFRAFVNKAQLVRRDIFDLFLENLLDIQHIDLQGRCSLSPKNYNNIWYGCLMFYIKLFQIWGMSKEKAYFKFENASFELESLTMADYFSDLADSLQKRCEQIRFIKVILDDLSNTESVEEMKICQLEKVNSKNRRWKEQLIKLNEQDLIGRIRIQEVFMALCAHNLYFQVYGILRSVIDHNRYPDTLQELTDCASYCKLQMKMHIELGTFGSFSNMSFEFRKIKTGRECIQAMMDIMFSGISSVIGKVDSVESKAHIIYKLMNRDIIHKYLSGRQTNFTIAVQDGIYYRILYHLHPKNRLDDKDEILSPRQFSDLIWSFFYAVFQIDFYMLHNNDHFYEWETIIHDLFSAIRNNRSMPEIKDLLEQYYRHFQIELDKSKYLRLTAEELLYLRELDITIRGDKELKKLGAEELTKNINYLLDRLGKTIDFIDNLLEVNNLMKLKQDYLMIHSLLYREDITDNTKYNYYKAMEFCNEEDGYYEDIKIPRSVANFHNHVIDDNELQNLLDYIRSYRYYHSNNNTIKGNDICYITEISRRLLKHWKKLSAIFCSKERINDMIQGNENAGLINCEEIKNLYRTVRNAFLYIRFEDWLDENLIIK